MKYAENADIVREYRAAFRKHANNGIIDMDDYLQHTFSFQIHRLENIVSAWEGIIPAYRQSQFLFALVNNGTGEKTIGHYRFPIQKNTLFVVAPRVPNSSKYYSLDCSGFMLSFDMKFFLEHFPQNFLANKKIFKQSVRPYVVLSNDQADHLSKIFEFLLEEYKQLLTDKDQMIAAKVLELLIQCERYFEGPASYHETESYCKVIESFNELIRVHCSTERSVQFYAHALHIHPNYLNFLIKKYSGLTAKQAIADHVILEAKRLLGSPSLSVKEISYKLGFTAPGSFSSFFKKMSNMSPSKYRQASITEGSKKNAALQETPARK